MVFILYYQRAFKWRFFFKLSDNSLNLEKLGFPQQFFSNFVIRAQKFTIAEVVQNVPTQKKSKYINTNKNCDLSLLFSVASNLRIIFWTKTSSYGGLGVVSYLDREGGGGGGGGISSRSTYSVMTIRYFMGRGSKYSRTYVGHARHLFPRCVTTQIFSSPRSRYR